MIKKSISPNVLLYITTLFFGFSSSIIQVILIRELLTIFRGNEFIIGIIFSAWFFGIFLGARYNPETEAIVLKKRINKALLILPVIFLVQLNIIYFIPLVIPVIKGTFYSVSIEFLLIIVLTIPVSILIGVVFPPIVKLLSLEKKERSGGIVYYIETIGSFIGGIIFSFFFIDVFNPFAIIAIIIISSLLIFVASNKQKGFLFLLALPAALLIFSDFIEKNIFVYVWNETHTGRILEYKRTKYQKIVIEEIDGQLNIFGDGIFYQSIPDRYEARSLFHLIQSLRNNRNERVLLFGGQPGALLSNLLNTDISLINYFEIDNELFLMEKKYIDKFYKIDNKKLQIITEDLRSHLESSASKYDLIISLPPSPENAMLNRFYTSEFYSLCKSHLSPGGIFITSIHGFSNYISPVLRDYIASVFKSFKNIYSNYMYTSGETIYLIGTSSENRIPGNYNALIEKYKSEWDSRSALNIEKEIYKNFDPNELRMLFEKSQLNYFRDHIELAVNDISENRDLKPVAYWKKIMLSAYQDNSLFYLFFANYQYLILAALLIIIIVFTDVKKSYGKDRTIAGFVIFIIGFISISTMILLLILYQNNHGIVYYRISLINALFMSGLAAGSYIINRYNINRLNYILVLLIMTLGIVNLTSGFRCEFLFWAIILIVSILCGSVFPSLFITYCGTSYHSTASLLDSMDHFGSIMGSFLTALILLPILGIDGTIILNISLVSLALIANWKKRGFFNSIF